MQMLLEQQGKRASEFQVLNISIEIEIEFEIAIDSEEDLVGSAAERGDVFRVVAGMEYGRS